MELLVLRTSTQKFVFLLHLLIMQILAVVLCSFPDNLEPRIKVSSTDVMSRIFTGIPKISTSKDDMILFQDLQAMKRMMFGGKDSVVISAKSAMYLLDIDEVANTSSRQYIPYNDALIWRSDNSTKDLCRKKGKQENRCGNFLRVIETYDERGDTFLLCGTNAYSPKCRRYKTSVYDGHVAFTEGDTFDGSQMCPYGPEKTGVARISPDDESLYTATFSDFSGLTPVILRDSDQLRQDPSNQILSDPEFIKMSEDDQRILLFFNEIKTTTTGEKRIVPQIAQKLPLGSSCMFLHPGQHPSQLAVKVSPTAHLISLSRDSPAPGETPRHMSG